MKRLLLLTCAWITCILGCIGIIIPVLPTTPFILLSAFLFAKSSPRLHAWVQSTKVYKTYVTPFKDAGGLPLSTKLRILFLSYAVMGLSAYFVQKWFVWLVLGLVALFLIYLMFIRIPTISRQEILLRRQKQDLDSQKL